MNVLKCVSFILTFPIMLTCNCVWVHLRPLQTHHHQPTLCPFMLQLCCCRSRLSSSGGRLHIKGSVIWLQHAASTTNEPGLKASVEQVPLSQTLIRSHSTLFFDKENNANKLPNIYSILLFFEFTYTSKGLKACSTTVQH